MSKLSKIINEEYAKLVERASVNEDGETVQSMNELSPKTYGSYLNAPGGGYDRLKQARKATNRAAMKYGKSPETDTVLQNVEKNALRNVRRAQHNRQFPRTPEKTEGKAMPENIQNLVDLVNEEYENIQNAKITIIAESIRNLVREEFEAMLQEVEPNRSKIAEKLEELRTRLIKDGAISRYIRGQALREYGQRPEARIPVATVAELIQFPISEVTLYFLTGHRIHEGQTNIEYHMGSVRFYGETAANVVEK